MLKLGFFVLVLSAFAPLAWQRILGPGERNRVRNRLAGVRGAAKGR